MKTVQLPIRGKVVQQIAKVGVGHIVEINEGEIAREGLKESWPCLSSLRAPAVITTGARVPLCAKLFWGMVAR